MSTEITKKMTIKTDSYQIEYHPSEQQFIIIFSHPLQVEGVTLGELRIFLEEKIVREMVEVLPPSEPELIH